MNEQKQFWQSFISIYRSHPCLWKIKSKEYMNSDLRNAAYSELIEKCKEITPDSDLSFVKKKIESMRNCYRRELRKVRQSKNTGSSTDSLYEPTLWYYELLHYTSDQEEARPGTSSISSSFSTIDGTDDSNAQQPYSPSIVSEASSPPTPISCKTKRKPMSLALKIAKFIDIASTGLLRPKFKEQPFGDSLCNDLENMEERQCIIAKKIISDVLYHGRMGKLNEHSSITVNRAPQAMMFNSDPSYYAASTYNYATTTASIQALNITQTMPHPQQEYSNIGQFQPSPMQTSTNSITEQRSLHPVVNILEDVTIVNPRETTLRQFIKFKE